MADEAFPAPQPEADRPVYERALDKVADLCMLVAGTLLVFLIVTFGWLVFGRYVLNDTPTWVEQSSLLIIAYITFLGAAIGVREKTHLSIELGRDVMPAFLVIGLRLFADLLLLGFGFMMAWQGWVLIMKDLNRKIPMIDLAESWRAAPLLAGGVLIVLFVTADMASQVIARRKAGS